ncbi:major capsid protein [Bacteroides congonensis]|uniref:major capsid protein n=1 Tax=Bacteroides congonensis TaxID=1871006 RepID=UPI00267539FD|nr:major capsid protein [Bacteroides congonensis]
MSQQIFDATLDPNNDVKVNNFDWSHANNLTTQIGRVTPIFCDLVPAKTSFRVNPRFGLQFMPMVFPIQTRMKARVSWFRYPLRALWKDYKDFVGNFREGLEEPYINFNTEQRLKKMASTGSLGDYLGLPTTLVGKYGSEITSRETTSRYGKSISVTGLFSDIEVGQFIGIYFSNPPVAPEQTFTVAFGFPVSNPDTAKSVFLDYDTTPSLDSYSIVLCDSTDKVLAKYANVGSFKWVENTAIVYILVGNNGGMFTFSSGNYTLNNDGYIEFRYSTLGGSVPSELSLATSPWYNSNSANKDKQQKILAYGFRAYEGIYNSFIRDNRNNPYYLNGKVQYNTWIPNDEGGEDNELYELRYANWEKDFLTTAVQSPQQGNAPLVGITTYTQTVANEDGTNTELIKTALVDEDGKKYGLSFKTSDEGLEGVEYLELDNGTKVRQARSLYDLATSGISIPDLRMVNCYQKFLELNMRKGYSYKDIVEGRFDVKVRYADLLMPEFFGGVSRDIDVNSVTQTVDQNIGKENPTYAEALGSQSGIAGVRGEANANIECFCDEESIIMGILIVTPLPVYTQLLPKHFTYRGLMEHYQPEFNLIGFQPIKYNEVCPIQAYNANPDSLTETFGYNRPWYEYAQKYDVAHGLFRTDLSNFLMHRVFNQKPELAQSFLLVDPEQVTDVFAVTETTDKIYGQIWLDITCKLPIARVAIPRLD